MNTKSLDDVYDFSDYFKITAIISEGVFKCYEIKCLKNNIIISC